MKVDMIRIRPVPEYTELVVRLINKNLGYFYSDVVVTPESHGKFLDALPPDDKLWIIKRDGVACGMVSVYHVDRLHRRCEWGRFAVDAEFRGVGSVVEFMVLEYVFGQMGMNKLYCEVFDENESVSSMHQKFGFVVEGHFRDHIWKGGRFMGVTYLSMLAKEWTMARERFMRLFSEKAGLVED